jgi:hypothetical protein
MTTLAFKNTAFRRADMCGIIMGSAWSGGGGLTAVELIDR